MSDGTGRGDGMSAVVSYRPGTWVGISGERVCALLQADLDHPLVVPLHEKVAAGCGIDDLLEVILAEGLRTTGAFVLAQFIDEQARVIARGDGVADVVDASGQTTRVQVASGIWADRRLDAVTVVLRPLEGEPSGPTLPLRAGVVRVSALTLGRGMPSAAQPTVVAEPARAAVSVVNPQAAVETGAVRSLPTPQEATPRLDPSQLPASDVPGAPADPAAHAVPADDLPGADAQGDRPSAGADDDDEGNAFDDLLMHTMMQRPVPPPVVAANPAPAGAAGVAGVDEGGPGVAGVQEGGIREPGSSAVDGRTLGPDEWSEALPASASTPTPSPLVDPRVVPPPPAGPHIIDAVPDFMGVDAGYGPPSGGPTPAAAPARSTASPSVSGPSLSVPSTPARADLTVNRSTLVGTGGAMRSVAPEVQAGRCPRGHLSPAHAAVCRVCGVPMPPQNAVWVPRPILGRLVFSNGDIVTLDRGLVLGRAPSLPPGHNGEQPNLVKLNDPTLEVSSQHLEVRLDHWYVLVVDLGSTNGTLVTLPGQQPMRLRPGTPQPIEPGTVVNLADVLTFTFEVTA
jgi:hypothetical protein